MLRTLRKLLACESGATAIEYGLIAGLISVAIIGILNVLHDDMIAMYQYISTHLRDALAST